MLCPTPRSQVFQPLHWKVAFQFYWPARILCLRIHWDRSENRGVVRYWQGCAVHYLWFPGCWMLRRVRGRGSWKPPKLPFMQWHNNVFAVWNLRGRAGNGLLGGHTDLSVPGNPSTLTPTPPRQQLLLPIPNELGTSQPSICSREGK